MFTRRVSLLYFHLNAENHEHILNRNIGPSEEMMKKQPKKKVKKSFTFPWWFKIIGYILAACFIGISIFFIIVKGISFGDDMCRKWLTAFLISRVTSIIFTQPIQVILLSIFVVLVLKKSKR